MRRHMPKLVHDPQLFSQNHSCTAWRWPSGSLTLLIAAALMVVAAAEVADATTYHAQRRRTSRRQGVDGAGFIAPASSATAWASFPTPGKQLRSVAGLGGAATRGGGSHYRHKCARTAASSGLLCCRGQTHGRQHSSIVARSPQLRSTSDCSCRGRGSSSSSRLLLLANAVGVDVNATVGAEIASPVASAEVALPLDVGTKKEHPPPLPPQVQSSRTKESTSVEGKEATVIITDAGGRPHTVASKAKISAANKGKKPWNVGVGHSEETRRKIAEGARNAAKRRRQKTAESLVREREIESRVGAGGSKLRPLLLLFLL